MNLLLDIQTRNNVLRTMAQLVQQEQQGLLQTNAKDMQDYQGGDLAMADRLKVDNGKIEGMVRSLEILATKPDPLGVERYNFTHENGIQVSNKTAPFGSVLIIYESRPDVTVEAAGIAFKSGNKILLKGGKESLQSNLFLVDLWHRALKEHGASEEWVKYLQFDRKQTQAFLEHPTEKLDLIVPRGGERLIAFVKEHAQCPVIVSGRGNNFLFVDKEADTEMAKKVILNAKTAKISACNALDKVLIDARLPNKNTFVMELEAALKEHDVTILSDGAFAELGNAQPITDEAVWYEEFLDYKIVIGEVPDLDAAIAKINIYGGGHSASIITKSDAAAEAFMANVDTAAVYHNASTRFTDGGEFGLGAELAISTDKLHQRGPLGLEHLVTNKWYVKGNGQTR